MTEHEIEHEFSTKLKWLDDAYANKQIDINEYEIELDSLEDWLEQQYSKVESKLLKKKMHTIGPTE